jgi:hypothetical protein
MAAESTGENGLPREMKTVIQFKHGYGGSNRMVHPMHPYSIFPGRISEAVVTDGQCYNFIIFEQVIRMSINQIRADVSSEAITFGPHLIERMVQNSISIDQVLDAIMTGNVAKKEPDEQSDGKFTKYTIRKGRLTVTVKDCQPAFIVTANRR